MWHIFPIKVRAHSSSYNHFSELKIFNLERIDGVFFDFQAITLAITIFKFRNFPIISELGLSLANLRQFCYEEEGTFGNDKFCFFIN